MGNLLNSTVNSASSVAADDQTTTFNLTMRILNAVLTFAFGYTFGGDFFPTGHAQLSAAIGGAAFTAIYDYGAYGWDAAGKRAGLSTRQLNVALSMSKTSMYASTLLSVAFLMLTTSLVDLSSIHDTIGLVAVIGTGLLLAAHFIQIFAYNRAAPEEVEAKQQADLRGSLSTFYSTQRQNIMTRLQSKVEARMLANLDEFAEREAEREWDKFVTEMGYSGSGQEKGAAAGTLTVEKEQGKTDDAPSASPPAPMTDEEKLNQVSKTFEERDYLEYQELKGKARAAQEQHLNMAAS